MANIIASAPAPSLRQGSVPEKPSERRFPCRHTYGAVDLGTKHVRVDADESVTPQAVVEAVNEAGYDEVTVLS